jgi:hypothetical protein
MQTLIGRYQFTYSPEWRVHVYRQIKNERVVRFLTHAKHEFNKTRDIYYLAFHPEFKCTVDLLSIDIGR